MNLSLDSHWMRKALQLSLNEMAVLCEIYTLSNNTKFNGWCIKSKQKISETLDLSKQSVHSVCNTLLLKGYIDKDEETKYLKPTDFVRAIAQEQENFNFLVKAEGFIVASEKMQGIMEQIVDSKESLPLDNKIDLTVKNLYPDSKESLPKYNISSTVDKKEIYKEKIIDETKKFYKNEIELYKAEPHIEGYRQFANYLFASNPFKEPIIPILKIPKQLPFDDYLKLLSKVAYNHAYILDILANFSNNKKYAKDKESIFLTINSWIIRDAKK